MATALRVGRSYRVAEGVSIWIRQCSLPPRIRSGRSNRSKRGRPPAPFEQHAETRSASGVVSIASRTRSGAERRARTTRRHPGRSAERHLGRARGRQARRPSGGLDHAANRRYGALFSASKVGLRYRSSMPAAEVPTPESPQAESGRSTIAVGGGGLRRLSDRKVNTALSFTLLGGLLILGGCSATSTASPATSNASTKSSTCVRKPPRLTPVTRSKLSTLPPSHDNDVGRRRLPDWYPDADQDANQVPQAGPCRKS